MSTAPLRDDPNPTDEAVPNGLKGNLCRYTGYEKTFDSVLDAATWMEDS